MQKHSSQFLFYLLSFTGPSLHLLRQQQALRKEASKSAAGHYLRKLFGETT